jgi:hypothetical protein
MSKKGKLAQFDMKLTITAIQAVLHIMIYQKIPPPL